MYSLASDSQGDEIREREKDDRIIIESDQAERKANPLLWRPNSDPFIQ